MKLKLLLFSILFFSQFIINAQVKFVRGFSDQPLSTYGNTTGFDVIELPGNGYVISTYKGNLIKTDINGVPSWQKKILRNNLPSIGSYMPLLVDAGNNQFYVSGNINTDTMVTIKIDASGNILWSKAFVSKGLYSRAISKASDGGMICTMSRQVGGIGTEAFILKLDENGNILWQRKYNAPNMIERIIIYDAQSLPNGNIIFSGSHQVSLINYPLIGSLNSSGAVLWVKQMAAGTSASTVPKLQALSNGNIRTVMTLLENSVYIYSIDFDANGNFISGNKYTGLPNSINGTSMGADGTITTNIVNSGGILRITPLGNADISTSFQVPQFDTYLSRVIPTSDNGFAFTGTFTINLFSESRCIFVKGGADGAIPGNFTSPFTVQKTTYTSSTSATTLTDSIISYGISLNIITGPFGSFYDTLFTLSTGVIESLNDDPGYSVMPNPVNDILNITSSTDVIRQLKVTDALGKEMLLLENVSFPLKLETALYPEGIYYLQMRTAQGENIQVQKIIIHH